MDIEQKKSIIAGAEETLQLLAEQPEWKSIESSAKFTTPNDVVKVKLFRLCSSYITHSTNSMKFPHPCLIY